MTTALTERPALDATVIEQVLLGGDLSKLSPSQRISYYNRTCESLGLNPLTKPFDYLTLNGKTILYARKDCTEQLRSLHTISVTILAREVVEGCYIVTARAQNAAGRQDESIGAVPIDGLKGESRSNAMMKAETKAKRRVTLSICGLGMLDETEVDSIPSATLGVALPPVVVEAAVVTPEGAVVDVESGAELEALPTEGEDAAHAYYILKVSANPTKAGKKRWALDLQGQTGTQTVTLWDERTATAAEQMAQNRVVAYVLLKTPTKWGTDVAKLERYHKLMASDAEIPPPSDEDIPF